VLIVGESAAEAVEEDIHRLRGDDGHHQGEAVTRRGTKGSIRMSGAVCAVPARLRSVPTLSVPATPEILMVSNPGYMPGMRH
jgi:hypothetical protein